jgi:hypothetical protein
MTAAKQWIIDNATISLIVLLITASSSLGVAIYKLNEAEKAITLTNQAMTLMAEKVVALTLANNTLVSEVKHLRKDFDKHINGHPVKVIR